MVDLRPCAHVNIACCTRRRDTDVRAGMQASKRPGGGQACRQADEYTGEQRWDGGSGENEKAKVGRGYALSVEQNWSYT